MMKLTARHIAIMLSVLSLKAIASPIFYGIEWTGSNGYSLTGEFSFDSSLLGTGAIDSSSLTSFSIEGFLNTNSVGTFDLFSDTLVAPDIFNFNFNTITESLITGGVSVSETGQAWAFGGSSVNCNTTGFGFASGFANEGFCINNEFVLDSRIATADSTLTATRLESAPVSAPASLGLMALGLFLLMRRRASSI